MGFVSVGFYEILTDFCRQFFKSRPAQLASIKLHQSTQLGSDVPVPDARYIIMSAQLWCIFIIFLLNVQLKFYRDISSVQEAYAKCFAVHILKFEILKINEAKNI